MLQPTIRQLLSRIEELEEEFDAPDAERLEVWRNLIVWLNYAKNYDNELEALKALEPGDRLRELHNSLLWSFRHFVLLLPDDIKRADYWPEKCKLLIECYIIGALNADVQISELQQEIYLDDCIKFVIEMVRNPDNWREFDRAKRDQWKPKTEPAEEPREPVVPSMPENQTTIPALSPESQPETSITQSVRIRYIGGRAEGSFVVLTVTGHQPVKRDRVYEVPFHVWESIEIAEVQSEWRKI